MAIRPLLFLTCRSFVNGLKRSLLSPKRLIPTIVIIAYYVWVLVRPLMSGSMQLGRSGDWEFPPLELLDAIIFSGFAALSLILAFGIFSYRASFKAADVDVLFSTPVSPRTVLIFRIVRDYLATLLIPLVVILFSWNRFPLEALFTNVPNAKTAAYSWRALSVGLILMTATWVSMGYALSLYVNRNDRRSDQRKRIIAWSLVVLGVSVVGYILFRAMDFRSVSDFVAFSHQGWIRAVFFTATPAGQIVMGPLQGNASESLFGVGMLVAFTSIAVYLALRQADWMYDQAAVKGFGSEAMRQLQRKGDFMGVMAQAARQGKLKIRRPGWFQRLRVRGFVALIWKDALIQWRSVRTIMLVFTLFGLIFVAAPLFGHSRDRHDALGYTVMIMEAFVTFIVASMTSQSGFTELLHRVDLQKPLPFGPQTIVISEVVAKALPAMVIPVLSSLAAIFVLPSSWTELVAGAIFFPSLAAVICALVCVIVLLFPEIDDPSQRGFRGLVTLLGLFLVGAPGALVFLGVGYLAHTPILGSIPGALVNLGFAFALTVWGGGLYAGFNPSE